MKTGLTLEQMAKELQRRHEAKHDYIADTRALRMAIGNFGEVPSISVNLELPSGVVSATEGEVWQEQICGHYRIPREYAGRIRTQYPELYTRTFNTHFHDDARPAAERARMVRTLDGKARAFLSSRYRPLDNFELAEAVLPQLMELPGVMVESTQFTERRFYLKAVVHSTKAEVRKGDEVASGIVVSNSEVGAGSLQVQNFIDRLWCLNGAIFTTYGAKKFHTGKRAVEEEDGAYELYSDSTRALDDKAFFSKLRDIVKGVLDPRVFQGIVTKMQEAAGERIESKDIPAVVEVTAQHFGYTETTKAGILAHLIAGGDMTRYGLMNAITRQSQDEEDYERATQLEMDGATIIELPRQDWKRITLAEAA